MANRVSLNPGLPTDMDPHLRRSLMAIFREHAKQINLATGHDITAVSTATTVAHDIVLADASATAVAVTLPLAANWRDRSMRVKKIDAGSNRVNVIAQQGETIDGTATIAISQPNTSIELVAANGAWYLV